MCQEYAIPHHSEQQSLSGYSGLESHTPMRPPPPLHNFLPKPPPVPPPPEQYYAAAEICPTGPIPTPCSPPGKISSLFMLPLSPDLEIEDSSGREDDDDHQVELFEFPREHLRIIEDFGDSHFGAVQLCEIPLQVAIERGACCQYVSLHTLRREARGDFMREVRTLARLNDANVARLIGACVESEPMCAIREYADFGDLCQFLQDHIAETTTTRPPNARTLR